MQRKNDCRIFTINDSFFVENSNKSEKKMYICKLLHQTNKIIIY